MTNYYILVVVVVIQKAKKECYPDKEAFRATATFAEVELQALLDKTV